MRLHCRHDNSDEHSIQSDPERIHHHIGQNLPANGPRKRPAAPTEVRQHHQPQEILRIHLARLGHGYGVDFIGNPRTQEDALERPEIRIHLLRKGNSHQGIAQVDKQARYSHL